MHDGVIKIRIAAPTVGNEANLALVEFIAVALGISKQSVRIVMSRSFINLGYLYSALNRENSIKF
jgi:uncharacterized protein YggU (UPF0235/DUF167 family)